MSSIIEELRQEQQQQIPQVEHPDSIGEEPTDTANEQAPFNSIEDVLGEVARQRAEFEAEQNRK